MISSVSKLGVLLCCALAPVCLSAQEQPFNTIKLYVKQDPGAVSDLPENLRDRLFSKVTQLINQTGVAELGYSNFYVIPRLDTVGTYVDDAGIGKIYTTECELTLTIENKLYSPRQQRMVFSSIARKLTGSATRREDALFNAIGSISPGDPELVKFLQQAKARISAYFQQHCKEVIDEAQQAYQLEDFAQSISLYFSVPSDAPCYKEAQSGIQKTYVKYVAQDCNKQLLQLKAFVARAQTTNDTVSLTNYDEVMKIIENLDPASKDCYGEATNLIKKIEGRFNEEQRHAWELKKMSAGKDRNETEVKKQMRTAVSKISIQYQATVQSPSGSHH
ncbi:MAG TPA: hypothetical protein VNS58_28945 [Puia sp.]|nr:hypothetical protein [Puia sp.]